MLPNTFPKAKTAKEMTEQRQNQAVSFYKNSQEVQDPGNQIVRRTSNLPLASFNAYLREAQTEANLGITVFKQTYPYITPLRSLYPVKQRDFLPTDLGAPIDLWLDAADSSTLVLSGSTVTQWNDKSGFRRNGIATGAPQLGTTTTGRQAITFGGSDFFKLTNNISPNFTRSNMTWFIVAYATADRNLMHLFTNQRIISFQLYYNSQVGNFFFTPSKPFLNQNTICTIVENVGVQAAAFINGTGAAGMTQSSLAVPIGSEITVGAHGDYTNAWIGNIQETIIYSTPLSTADRQKIEGYLAWKWGTEGSLPTNHPYKNAKPDPIVSNYL